MKARLKLWILQLCSFLFSIGPLAVVFFLNREKYIGSPDVSPQQTVKLCTGAIIIIIFVMFKVLGKIKVPSRIVTFAIVFALSYLLEAVLTDLFLLSGMALLGEALDLIFFKRAVANARENITVGKTADATADKVREVLSEYMGRV